MSERKSITMKDVAQEAGVALGTVSKVFNGIPVGESYRVRVLEAAAKLNYQVNSYARGLRSSKTNTIAVILPKLAHPFFSAFAEHVCQALQKRSYRMILSITAYDVHAEQECINMVQQNKVDGIIAITYNPELKIDENIPFVIIDRKLNAPVPCITSDNFQGGEMAAKKLSQLGCRHLLFIGTSSEVPGEIEKRSIGFSTYCDRNEIPHDSFQVLDSEAGQIPGFLQGRITEGRFAYDGIFCHTDCNAVMVAKYLRSQQVRVPEDVQIIGFDGARAFGNGDYFCSTIVQPLEQMAENAVEILLDPERASSPSLLCLPVTYQPGGTTLDR